MILSENTTKQDDGVRLVLGSDVANTKGKAAPKTMTYDQTRDEALTELSVPTMYLILASPWAFDPNCTSSSVEEALQAGCSLVGTWECCGFGCGLDPTQEQHWEELLIGLGYPSST